MSGSEQAASEEFKATEEGLLKLQGVESRTIQGVVADIHKRHENLLERINRRIEEGAREARELKE